IKAAIMTKIIDPIAKVELAISSKDINKIPKDLLGDQVFGYLNDFLLSYPSSYKSKNSVYYDVKASPRKHLFAYYKLAKLFESSKLKSFRCFPLRSLFVLAHMTIDTMIQSNYILKRLGSKLDKQNVRGQVMNITNKVFKPEVEDKSMQFRGAIMTDGVSISIIKQNTDKYKQRRWFKLKLFFQHCYR
ncbi:hypothetical protein BD770DRAFT_326831, partial [Pilaira anomala]